jgi:hypothetical protein
LLSVSTLNWTFTFFFSFFSFLSPTTYWTV